MTLSLQLSVMASPNYAHKACTARPKRECGLLVSSGGDNRTIGARV
jgi:hypothetical protein